MEKLEVHAELTKIFRDVFDNEDLEISDSTTAADIEDWDSINHVNLVVAVEKGFKIRFSTKEVKSMENVGEFIESILQKLKS